MSDKNENRLYFSTDTKIDFVSVEKGEQYYDVNFFKHPKITKDTRLFNDYGNRYEDTTPYMPETVKRVKAYYFDATLQEGIKFDIYKKTPEQKYYTYVSTMNSYKVYDYNIKSGQYYHYLATVNENDGTVSTYSMINEQTGEDKYYRRTFNNWTICNIEEDGDNESLYKKVGKTWNLGYNLEMPTITQNISVTSWDTIGRYPKVSIGQRKYDSAHFSGLLGLIEEYESYEFIGENNPNDFSPKQIYNYTEKNESFTNKDYKDYESELADNAQYACEVWTVTNKYATEMDKLEAWKDFITDGELKLLRDTKGNSWIIQITDVPDYAIDYISNLKETKISFQWKEVVDTSNISIISFDSLSEME